MSINKHLESQNLESYCFLWSEMRLIIGAVALFLGGRPPVYALVPVGIVWQLLGIAWIVSGIASAYLLYKWYIGGQKIFGGKNQKDTGAFIIMVITGLNLGFAGLFGKNIGFSISTNYILFIAVGLLYLASAWHLYQRWESRGQKLF